MRERILEILENIEPDIVTFEGDDLFESGVIDSMAIIDIVTEIEDEFDIEIDAELVIAENFANVDTILGFILPLLED